MWHIYETIHKQRVLFVLPFILWCRPIVSSHTRPCGHFTGCTTPPPKKKKPKKKKTTTTKNSGWKDKKRQTLILNCKRLKLEWHLSIPVCIYAELCKKMLTHLVIVPTFFLPASGSHSQLWMPLCSGLTASGFHSCLTDVLRSSLPVSPVFAGSALCVIFAPI